MDDEETMIEDETEDDDLLADLEGESEEEPEAQAAPEAKEAPKPKMAKAKKVDPNEAELAAYGLNALKKSWEAEAKAAGHAAADFSSIGLTGIDDEAKTAFLSAAADSHKARVDEMTKLGFVFQPGSVQDAVDEQRKQEWGKTGPGLPAEGDVKLNEQITSEVAKGNVRGVIEALPDLGTFFVKGRRG